ncbi:amidase family protein, partial [Leptospira sp. 96542]|nr:amidase family protein [Leptospira sp. 96542]
MVHIPSPVRPSTPTLSPEGARAWISREAPPLQGSIPGPLAGLCFAAKDNIDAAGLRTTSACEAFAYMPVAHATVVRKLLDAGAALAGK